MIAMTPDMIAMEIRTRTEEAASALVLRKRLDPQVYEVVINALAQLDATKREDVKRV